MLWNSSDKTFKVSKTLKVELRIADDLVRLSVGIEDAEDLLADLENALK